MSSHAIIQSLLLVLIPGAAFAGEIARHTPPEMRHFAKPEYSESARRAGYEGLVQVRVSVGRDGIPTEAVALDKPGMGLERKAEECAMQWRFKAATEDGEPVPARVIVPVRFQLANAAKGR